jgi:hypothetical protein
MGRDSGNRKKEEKVMCDPGLISAEKNLQALLYLALMSRDIYNESQEHCECRREDAISVQALKEGEDYAEGCLWQK